METRIQESYDTVVVGGGQAGLSAGYYLRRRSSSFVILDAQVRPGESWRRRWDSLRLFTPAQYDGLPGLPFPARHGTFPTKDAMADYLEKYAAHFELPLINGSKVLRIMRAKDELVVDCEDRRFVSRNVIVAVGAYACPYVPDFARMLSPHIRQLHSSAYRRPEDIPDATVLVAGYGTSGTEIAMELAAAGRSVLLSGQPTAQVLSKFVPAIFAGRNPLAMLLGRAYWNFIHHVVTIDTPLGRKAKSQIVGRGQPLVRLNAKDVLASGVEHVAKVNGVTDGRLRLAGGRVPEVSSIVWCTGFRSNYEWLDLPGLSFDAKGLPVAPHGIAPEVPGLYFLGLPFQTGLTSTLVGGVARDAALVVQHIDRLQIAGSASNHTIEFATAR